MGFFSSIGHAFSSAASTVGSGLKSVSSAVVSVATPVYNKAIKPLYNKVVKPVANRAITYVEHGIDRLERVADAGTKGAEGVGNLFSNIGSSPMLIAGLIGVGAIVMLRK